MRHVHSKNILILDDELEQTNENINNDERMMKMMTFIFAQHHNDTNACVIY